VNNAISILRSEHRSISAVLHGLKQLAKQAQDASVRPRFAVFRAMLRYLDEYPERLHHPKEDQHLFARLAQRAPETQTLIDQLHAEHLHGAILIRELERALMLFEDAWPGGARNFQAAVDAYCEFHWKHMRKEEEQLLLLAERHLQPQDWAAVDAAFAANADPIAGMREHDFEQLFTRIANLAPAPIGLGEPWKNASSA
jgi:hemerythrin-like domain-containing protein